MLGLLLALAVAAPVPDVQLVGVVVARSPGRSVAILRSAGRTRVVAIGDSAFGGRLVAVAVGGASLDFAGETVSLRLLANAAPALSAPLPARAASTGASEGATPPARAMERREVDRRLSIEIPRILAETTVVPVMEDGHVSGLALTRVPEGTLLTEAGLRPGDVLTEINDTRIDGMGTLIGLWPRLQSASELRATVLRNGQRVSLNLTLK